MPIEKIVARYTRSLANLAVVLRIADRAYVYDNSIEDTEALLCARSADAQLWKIYAPLPQWVADRVLELPRHPEFVDLRAA